MEDTEKRPAICEREKLGQEIWVEPVKIVARRYSHFNSNPNMQLLADHRGEQLR